jgi:hypothetical protein
VSIEQTLAALVERAVRDAAVVELEQEPAFRRRIATTRAVMQTPEGRRLVGDVIYEQGRLLKEPFTGNSQTFYRAGQMEVGRSLHALVRTYLPREFVLMELERLVEQLGPMAAEAVERDEED